MCRPTLPKIFIPVTRNTLIFFWPQWDDCKTRKDASKNAMSYLTKQAPYTKLEQQK